MLLEHNRLPLAEQPPQLGEPLIEALLRPTRIYCKAALAACATSAVRGLCHVTGGGLPGNLPRILPDGLGAELDTKTWNRPPIFKLIQELGDVPMAEMWRAFNMGLGFVAVVAPDGSDAVLQALHAQGEEAMVVGRVTEMPGVQGEDRVHLS